MYVEKQILSDLEKTGLKPIVIPGFHNMISFMFNLEDSFKFMDYCDAHNINVLGADGFRIFPDGLQPDLSFIYDGKTTERNREFMLYEGTPFGDEGYIFRICLGKKTRRHIKSISSLRNREKLRQGAKRPLIRVGPGKIINEPGPPARLRDLPPFALIPAHRGNARERKYYEERLR